MKIKESKFYRPKTYLMAGECDNDRATFAPSERETYHADNPFTVLLNDCLADCLPYTGDLVIKEKHLSDFVKCTDFVCYSYSRTQQKLIEVEQCYFHADMEIFITLTPDLSNEYDKENYEQGIFRVKAIYYDNEDSRQADNLPKFFNQYLEKYMSNEHKISILVSEHGRFEVVKHKIKPYSLDIKQMYNDDFLPVHEHIIHELTTSQKGIVLLHGLAGTGKTNYIKWLTSQVSSKEFIFVPTTMINRLTEPSFINVLMENKKAVLVLEDCENYISERTVDNPHTDVVASILNIADGMLSDIIECQMICTFNASIDKIDTALLRKGRLIAEYCFKALSAEKANAYFKSIGSDSHTDKPLTLAEITHMQDKEFREKQPEKLKFGFV